MLSNFAEIFKDFLVYQQPPIETKFTVFVEYAKYKYLYFAKYKYKMALKKFVPCLKIKNYTKNIPKRKFTYKIIV